MKTTAFWRLTWKEYRAIRTFWLSIVGLVVLLSWVFVLTQERATAINLVFNFALGAPAFFAIGCAGAAFAAEKEEGTFEFLRASPASSGQILASKLLLTAIATLAMYAVLWPLALWATGAHLPEPTQLPGMLGLWLVGAIEAIAWGTLFSLLGARPLLAVVLAIAAASTFAHSLSWGFRQSSNYGFEWMSYLRAAPWRALIALAVLGIDIYLGRHWLDAALPISKRRTPLWLARIAGDDPALARALLVRRSPGAMLGRLLWQHLRQSGWLMILMAVLFVAFGGGLLAVVAAGGILRLGDLDVPWSMAAIGSLIGSMVFLSDQERYRYRFFSEHNVPPRLVWFTRQFCWLVTLLIATAVVCYFWVKHSNVKYLWELLTVATDPHGNWWYGRPYFSIPPFGVGLAFVALAYCAGQYVSMFVRSGIMAGFLGLVFSLVLCSWALLMRAMQISFIWSVLPIPVVLLVATWLRAPDWISENRRKGARVRAAAMLAAPAAALMIAVPIHRVHQIPVSQPPYDSAPFETELETKLAEGAATVRLYREADWQFSIQELFPELSENDADLAYEFLHGTRHPTDQARAGWLEKNRPVLDLLLKAAQAPDCQLFDPFKAAGGASLVHEDGMLALLLASAGDLESEGKLDEALERYFTAARVSRDLATADPFRDDIGGVAAIFRQITTWGGLKGQTPERLRAAIARLHDVSPDILRFDTAIEANYVYMRRVIGGDKEARQTYLEQHDSGQIASSIFWATIMPWENDRAMRVLNVITPTALWRLDDIKRILAAQGGTGREPQFWERRENPNVSPDLRLIDVIQTAGWSNWFDRPNGESSRFAPFIGRGIGGDQITQWVSTTSPSLFPVEQSGVGATKAVVQFEARKRGTMLVLALEAYRLENGKLPDTLDEVMNTYFDRWPLDPYSGREFRYFPTDTSIYGPPKYAEQEMARAKAARSEATTDPSGSSPADAATTAPETDSLPSAIVDQLYFIEQTAPGRPGVWCTGPELVCDPTEVRWVDEATGKEHVFPTYQYREHGSWRIIPVSSALSRGFWFPIPDQQK